MFTQIVNHIAIVIFVKNNCINNFFSNHIVEVNPPIHFLMRIWIRGTRNYCYMQLGSSREM